MTPGRAGWTPARVWIDHEPRRCVAYEDGIDFVQHRFSPDQRWTVISLRDRAEAQVYVMPAEGGPRIPATDRGWYDDKPRWAPDGRTLYFVSNRGGRSDVWGPVRPSASRRASCFASPPSIKAPAH